MNTPSPSTEHKWFQPDAWDGNSTHRQHAYIKDSSGEARAACSSRRRLLDESEMFMQFTEVESELLNEKAACKTCLKIINS